GTYYYNDDWCGEQSLVSGIFMEDEVYYIRIGDAGVSCESTPIFWEITYIGPPSGCTDPYACNYAPLAVINDGSCIYPGDPDCPSGPDLILDATYFDGLPTFGSDFSVNVYDADWDDCAFEEACVTGTGERYVLKFGIKISNIGDVDYHLGSPDDGAPGFIFSPCHNHWHYADYGEYLLYDEFGNIIPAGHKNGYAVMDVGCFDGTPQYGGGNMGISAGCYDIYGRGTTCQWVDLTDVPDGNYTLVARVNWENNPDVDGHTETNLANNWMSICIHLERDAPGAMPTVTKVDDCAPYYDCYGEIFGSAAFDCTGACNGPALIGDLNADTAHTHVDVDTYIERILNNTILAGTCNDANADGDVDVYDAALVSGCAWQEAGVTHIIDLCNMPYGYLNTNDTVLFSIGDINTEMEYLDLFALNPSADILGFQLSFDGLAIDSVVKLAPSITTTDFRMQHSATEIIGLGYDESGFIKSYSPMPVARIYYSATYPTTICIDYVTTAVNEDYHEVVAENSNACYTLTSVFNVENNNNLLDVHLYPHPVTGESFLNFNNPLREVFTLHIFDLTGNLLRTLPSITGNKFVITKNSLSAGLYIYQLESDAVTVQGKFVVQ
ncbi:MAG: lysyl oxidase family protein, partial [Chitinophagales bacterium]